MSYKSLMNKILYNFCMEPTSNSCSFQPSIIFLLLTLIVTSVTTVMLCSAIMTKNWEYITWDKEKLRSIEKNLTNESNEMNGFKLEWLLDGQVARLILESKNFRQKPAKELFEKPKENNNLPALFFAPIHGGIWTFCITITAKQQQLLINMGFPKILCTNYLKLNSKAEGNSKMNWQHRMQNLSISCALVCLIILSSSALIGAFGVTKRQISAVLVTGVMYFLAGVFATFSLSIIHFKRARSKSDCLNTGTIYSYTAEGVLVSSTTLEKSYDLNKINKYYEARIFTTGWSLHLGWGGAAMCVIVGILWIFLSKIMRLSSVNTLLTIL